jgi:hypothetical protein
MCARGRGRAPSWTSKVGCGALASNGMSRYSARTRSTPTSFTPVYGWFTEGFDTLDLNEVKDLLDAMAS